MRDDVPPAEQPPRREWPIDEAWDRVRERIDAAESGPRLRWWTIQRASLVAAAAIVLAAVGVTLLHKRSTDAPARVVSTEAGERIAIRLADSSLVTLGPSTQIRYIASDTLRTMELTGLADFKVVHDERRPFVVRARNTVTRDVGTAFVVRAYPTDSVVSVAVSSGAVSLTGTVASSVVLRAGDVGQVDATGTPRRDERLRVDAATAWVEGRIVFENTTLADVAGELSRWFDVDIQVDNTLARRPVTAVYNRPTLDGVLDGLAMMLDARYERTGRTIVLHPAKP